MKKLVVVLILVTAFAVTYSHAIDDKWKATLKQNIDIVQARDTKYIWGASGQELNGRLRVDCSGLIYYLFIQSGIPVKRTVALRMRLGMDGWLGKDVELDDADIYDVPFWSWKDQPTRPHGHVGILITGKKSGLIEAVHASSSKGKVVAQPLQGVFIRDLSATRHITIGEKQEPVLGKGVIKTK